MKKQTAQRIRYAITLPVRIIFSILWITSIAIAKAANRLEWILDDVAEKIKAWTLWK